MGIHKVSGKYLRDALERAMQAYGGDAVVVSQVATGDGEVALAVADARPRDGAELLRLRGEATRLLTRTERVAAPRPSTADVERCLRTTGASEAWIGRLVKAVRARLDEGVHPLDLAGEEIARGFEIAHARPAQDRVTVVALLGPAGSGKTTCAMKLVARWRAAGLSVALASLDAHRIGAVEHMRALGNQLRVTTAVFQDATRLARALAGPNAPRVVVLEGSGRPERDLAELARLEQLAEERGFGLTVERTLVLAATHGDEVLDRALDAGDYDACAVTMLDETTRPARVLERVHDRGLALAFLSDGPELARLRKPSADALGDLMLRGRLA